MLKVAIPLGMVISFYFWVTGTVVWGINLWYKYGMMWHKRLDALRICPTEVANGEALDWARTTKLRVVEKAYAG